ncbi:sigma-70 family RNA polymerase sigma factor [Gammaproteobacteria bacterium AS21]
MNNIYALKHSNMQDTKLEWADLLTNIAQHQDKQSFSDIFNHFAPRIKAYILRLGLTESVAEELMQETMISVWRKASYYRKDKAAASTWIFTIARNISIDWMRSKKYPQSLGDEWDDNLAVDSSADTQGEDLILRHQVSNILNTLPEKQAQVIYMSFYEGRAHSDISQRLGIPLGSVKSRIRLASIKFKAAWEQTNEH